MHRRRVFKEERRRRVLCWEERLRRVPRWEERRALVAQRGNEKLQMEARRHFPEQAQWAGQLHSQRLLPAV
jgi:hypothetical protein